MKTTLVLRLWATGFFAILQVLAPCAQSTPDRDRPGPWDNDVLVYRVGTSGELEKRATFERAGVPTMARIKDGRLIAAFQHFPQDDDRNFDRVAVRFSGDEGMTWTQPQPIVVEDMETGLARPFDPTLVTLPDGRMRLYFTSNRSSDLRRSAPHIYSAISTNGIHFLFEPGVRFGLEGRVVIDCAVALHSGIFHLIVPDNGAAADFMARSQGGQQPTDSRGYHAISDDGLHFRRVADVKLAYPQDRWLGNLQSDTENLVFFGTGPGLWPLVSRDGVKWETPGYAVRLPGADPGAVKLRDGSWLLLVTGPPRPGAPSTRRHQQDHPRKAIPGAVPADAEGSRPTRRPPPGVRERGEFPQFESVFIRIPSSVAGKEGVAASLLFPREARFTNGAPIVISVSGGVQAGSARGRPEYVRHGFVEVHFAFPGGGAGDERSGGTYDFRGTNCIRALADVIRFTTGRLADKQGRFIGDLARGLSVLTNNVGLVGSSHGGNACGLAMAKFGNEFPNLAWYTSMESPYGEGAANVELGGKESGVNPAYDPGTGVLNLSKLAWSGELSPRLFRKPMLVSTRELKGAFYFDLNGDARFSPGDDFSCNCFVGDAGDGVKAWYSPRILAESDSRGLIPGKRPAHLPTLAEAREFWMWRDAAPSIQDAVRHCTNLAVIVYANERDHVQADPAHTHIVVQEEGFRKAGVKFIRLNPDRAYVEHVMVSLPPRLRAGSSFPDNPAGKTWTRINIAQGLEPSAVTLGLCMQAAVCELADRTQFGNWAPNLNAVLVADAAATAGSAPRAAPPPGL